MSVLAYRDKVYRMCYLPAIKQAQHNRWVKLYQQK